jgi:hypothetical protein
MVRFEYRISWSAMSNISFKGDTGWRTWEDEYEESAEDVRRAIEETQGRFNIPYGLEVVLEAAGIEWWCDVRPVAVSEASQ